MRLLPVLVLLTGCVTLEAPDPAAESRADLLRAFAERGWRTTSVQFVRPVGVVGQGTAYRVEGRTVVVFDYASPEEAAAAADRDVVSLRQLEAGQGVEIYRRPALVVLTYGRTRTAFDIQLARLLSGPPIVGKRRLRPEAASVGERR